MWDDMLSTDLAERVPSPDVPTNFLHDLFDHPGYYNLAHDYLQRFRAPVTRFTPRTLRVKPDLRGTREGRPVMRDDVLNAVARLPER